MDLREPRKYRAGATTDSIGASQKKYNDRRLRNTFTANGCLSALLVAPPDIHASPAGTATTSATRIKTAHDGYKSRKTASKVGTDIAVPFRLCRHGSVGQQASVPTPAAKQCRCDRQDHHLQ